jgi:hypothetical protein
MKVKQIVGEDQQSLYPGMAPGSKQKFTVAPNTIPSAPGQPKTVTLVPQGSQPGTPGQPVPGSITVAQDQIDMTDLANLKINPKAMQSQQQNQQPGALNNKTVTVGLGEEPNEDQLHIDPPQMGYQNTQLPKPGPTNMLTAKNVSGKFVASDGDPVEQTSTGKEIDQQYAQDPVNKLNRVGYFTANGQQYMALNTGHKWKVGPQALKALASNQPLQQEEQGEQTSLGRIAHLAGIK